MLVNNSINTINNENNINTDHNEHMVSIDIDDVVNNPVENLVVKKDNSILLSFLLLFTNFPIIFCDLYYAFNDKTCVQNKIENLYINMYDYLIVSGIYSIYIVLFLLCCILFKNKLYRNINKNNSYLFIIFLAITFFFNISWNIVGVILFKKIINNNTCSKEVFNYLFSSILLKLICYSINYLYLF